MVSRSSHYNEFAFSGRGFISGGKPVLANFILSRNISLILSFLGQYLNLDKDHNGMLSRSELLAYGTGTLTAAFVDRVFQECLTYGGEMDYKTYLDFVLALENRREPQALTYFFRILDVRQEGSLNTFVFNYFFRDIIKQMEKLNQVSIDSRAYPTVGHR